MIFKKEDKLELKSNQIMRLEMTLVKETGPNDTTFRVYECRFRTKDEERQEICLTLKKVLKEEFGMRCITEEEYKLFKKLKREASYDT